MMAFQQLAPRNYQAHFLAILAVTPKLGTLIKPKHLQLKLKQENG